LGSPSRKLMYIGKVQRAVLGQVIVLIISGPSGGGWFGYFKSIL